MTNEYIDKNSVTKETKTSKTNVNLSLDSQVIEAIREEADESGTSLNYRINTILKKYIQLYKKSEEYETLILPKEFFQFALDNIEENKMIEFFNNILSGMIPTILHHFGVPITLENIIKYFLSNVGSGAGAHSGATQYTDEEGHKCIVLRHVYTLKWSKIICSTLSKQIADLLHCHCECETLPKSVIIKILEKNIQ